MSFLDLKVMNEAIVVLYLKLWISNYGTISEFFFT